MKKFLTILTLCLLANSCTNKHQQTQNSQAVLHNPQVLNQGIFKPTTSEKSIKNVVVPASKQKQNIVTSSPTITPTPAEVLPSSFVNMKIITPEGESNFTVELKEGNNACDNLYEAKAENKIKSLTIKDAYLESLGSLYVYEINGFKNNWILSLNGKSSSFGCSKVFPKVGDIVEWKFN